MYCRIPAIKTPYASAIIGLSKKSVKNKAEEISDMFNITGVIAGIKNLLYVFNIPADSAVREIKNKYGKVIFNICDAVSSLLSSLEKPGANKLITFSEKITPNDTSKTKMIDKLPCTYEINLYSNFG